MTVQNKKSQNQLEKSNITPFGKKNSLNEMEMMRKMRKLFFVCENNSYIQSWEKPLTFNSIIQSNVTNKRSKVTNKQKVLLTSDMPFFSLPS